MNRGQKRVIGKFIYKIIRQLSTTSNQPMLLLRDSPTRRIARLPLV